MIQHSVMGNRQTMGGPVIDLNGHCIGMNIARASRAETYAIPSTELRRLADRMMGTPAINATHPNETTR